MSFASDVMTTNVVTVSPDDTAEAAMEILLQNEISGAPVLDDDRHLVGIISEFRLLAAVYDEEVANTPIQALMTREVISVHEDTRLSEIADKLNLHRIRRVPVVKAGRLTGLVSRRDLLRYIIRNRSIDIDRDALLALMA